jgi:hypothetical protein
MGTWCRLTVLGSGGDPLASWSVGGPGLPDLSVVEGLAWLLLILRRQKQRVVVEELEPGFAGLLDLVGLRREMAGEPERGE